MHILTSAISSSPSPRRANGKTRTSRELIRLIRVGPAPQLLFHKPRKRDRERGKERERERGDSPLETKCNASLIKSPAAGLYTPRGIPPMQLSATPALEWRRTRWGRQIYSVHFNLLLMQRPPRVYVHSAFVRTLILRLLISLPASYTL